LRPICSNTANPQRAHGSGRSGSPSTGQADLSSGDALRHYRRYDDRELARKNRERLDNCSGTKDD